MKQYVEKQKRTLIVSIFIFLLLALIIVVIGYRSYYAFEARSRAQAESRILTVAKSKVKGLYEFRKEILDDANYIYKNASFSDLASLYLKDRKNVEAQGDIRSWLEAYQADDQFDGIYLLDARGVGILSVPDEAPLLASAIKQKIPETLRSGRVTFVDFYRDEYDQRVYLALLTPIFDNDQQSHPVIGFLVLRSDPQIRLYPFLNERDSDSGTAESFLVRRDGDSFFYLSNLRSTANTALTLIVPLENTNNLVVKAGLGQRGIIEGVDYRGVAVIGAAQSVPNSPWLLVTHADLAEVYAPARNYFWQTIVVMGSIILYSGLGLLTFLRQRDLQFYRVEVAAAEKLRESEERFRSAFQYSAIGMALVSLEGKWLRVNPTLCAMLGYSEDDFLTKTFQETTHPDDLNVDLYNIRQALDGKIESYILEKRYLHKDGKIVWALLAAALVRDSAGVPLYLVSQIKDITERKRTEEELRLLTQELDNKVHARTAELQSVNEQLRALSQQMVDLQEKQIKNLARELHDGVGQNLTAININLSLLGQLLPENYPESVKSRIADTRRIVEDTVAQMRNVMADFLPPMLERYGLSSAILWYVEQFTKRTNIAVNFNDRCLNPTRLSPQAEVGLFRIVQEALNNVAKYARVAQAYIELKDDGDDLLMTIADDGAGFDPQVVFAIPTHWGFAIMRERARALDASFDIQSAPGKGVKIVLRIAR